MDVDADVREVRQGLEQQEPVLIDGRLVDLQLGQAPQATEVRNARVG